MKRRGFVPSNDRRPGARMQGDSGHYRVWAPRRESVEVVLTESGKTIALEADGDGYFSGTVSDITPGTRYRFRLDAELERPDPASRLQPDGVHGPSATVEDAWSWEASAPNVALEDYVIYEIHVGTFTPEGTFDGAIDRLDALRDLGVTVIELMPIAAFPGTRNWGYDGACPYAVQASYGGPDGLRRFVDACHARGLAVILDVVYNHLGPEGTYLADFGPYFTEVYRTPWGSAVNFDQPDSDGVREYFLHNALMWVDTYRLDGLRLDAIQAIFDQSARTFLEELTCAVHELAKTQDRVINVIAESNRNDPRTVIPSDQGGLGHDAMWVDDLHHALHAVVTGEDQGYYADYGDLDDVVQALKEGFVLRGQHSIYRGRRHGREPGALKAQQVITYLQNHDQTGNRQDGERITTMCGSRQHRLLAAATLLSPFTPLLFMGEEYAEPAPFLYFVDHGDKDLIEAVRAGRRRQFRSFDWPGEPPDPADPATFEASRIDWTLRDEREHAAMLNLYRDLLEVRERTKKRMGFALDRQDVRRHGEAVIIRRWNAAHDLEQVVVLNFGEGCSVPVGPKPWFVALETGAPRYTEQPHDAHVDTEIVRVPAHTAVVLEY